MHRTRIALALVLAGAGGWSAWPRPKTPEQAHRAEVEAKCEQARAEIARREALIAQDEKSVHQARLLSFRQQYRGAEAKEEGRRLRERAEQGREENIHQIARLKGQLVELEFELRGMP